MADALPGVAIAISLVPPLCVVGICLSTGDLGAAGGAGLLFVKNLVAILVAGGGLLALMGYGAVARREMRPAGRGRAALVTGVTLMAVVVPLGLTSYRLALDSTLESTVRAEARAWLDGSGYELVAVDADDRDVDIVIDGIGPLPSTAPLVEAIERGRPGIRLEIRAVLAQRIELSAASPDGGAGPPP